MNSSFVILPKQPMQPRSYDPRVGFFTVGYTDFDANPQGVETTILVKRWRLEPKEEDMEKYKGGELVEPKEQIVYYIDPATPKQWRPYLIAGINDWNVAFEAAGFKNAIVGKEWPENDTTMSLEDKRYKVLRYLPSDVPNAYGPNIHDPRSGEILEGYIGWYHNVMELLHSWYMIQAAAVDPRARAAKFDDELMGELIERLVGVQGLDHIVAEQPDRPRRVVGIARRIGIPRQIEPLVRPVFAIGLLFQQPIDEPLIGLRIVVAKELLQFRQGRRQSSQAEAEAAQ
jgi:hypothetical protein